MIQIVENEADGSICNDVEVLDAVFDLLVAQTNKSLARTKVHPRLRFSCIKPSSTHHSDPARLGLSRRIPRLTSESARSSQGKSLSMLEVFFDYLEKKRWSENAGSIYKLSRLQHK